MSTVSSSTKKTSTGDTTEKEKGKKGKSSSDNKKSYQSRRRRRSVANGLSMSALWNFVWIGFLVLIVGGAVFTAAFFISKNALKQDHHTVHFDEQQLHVFNLTHELSRNGKDGYLLHIVVETDVMMLVASNTRVIHYDIHPDTQEIYNITMDGDASLMIIHKLSSASVSASKENSSLTPSSKLESFSDIVKYSFFHSKSLEKHMKRQVSCFGINSFNARLVQGMPWTIDTWNPYLLSAPWLRYMARKSMDTWQSQTSSLLWGALEEQALLSHINTSAPANYNGMRFATVVDSQGRTNTILAITITWYRSNSLYQFEIAHWNQLYNTGLPQWWGDSVLETNVFDVQSTMTHELGHTIGLSDMYTSPQCNDVTMFFSGSLNEVKKRSLADPDIEGVHELYGQVEQGSPSPTFYAPNSQPPSIRNNNAPSTTKPSTNHAATHSFDMWFRGSILLLVLLLFE